MLNMPLFISVLIGFALLCIWIGKRSAEKTESCEDYFLGKRSLGVFALTLTLLATQLGGGALLGASDEAYCHGWSVIFYPLGMCLGLVILGLGYGAKMRKLNLNTTAELFERVYGSVFLRRIAGLLSVATLFFILIGQGIAVQKFFNALGFDGMYVFYGFWLVVILYTVLGGLKAVVNTDIVQVIFVMAIFAAVFFVAKSAPVEKMALMPMESGKIPYFAWLLMPLFFMLIEQDIGQRCFAAKKPRVVSISCLLAAGALMACSLFAIYFGVLGRDLGIATDGGKSIIFLTVAATTSPVFTTLFACAFLMVILSTADSLLCAISSNLAFDFPLIKKKNPKARVRMSQLITFIVGVSAMVISTYFQDVLPVLIQSYELSVCTLFVPITMAIFSKKLTVEAAFTSMAMGAIGFITFRIWEVPFPKELISIGMSYAGFMAVQRMKRVAA